MNSSTVYALLLFVALSLSSVEVHASLVHRDAVFNSSDDFVGLPQHVFLPRVYQVIKRPQGVGTILGQSLAAALYDVRAALLVFKCSSSSREGEEGVSSDPVILANSSHVVVKVTRQHLEAVQESRRKEIMLFVSRTVAKRTELSQRQSVEFHGFRVNAYNRNGLCALGLMDHNYPLPSAFSLLKQVIDEYRKTFGDFWKTAREDKVQHWPYLDEALAKLVSEQQTFQYHSDRRRIHRETKKIILHKTLDSVLAPGEKLESLINKSSDLSAPSRVYALREWERCQCQCGMKL